MNRLSRLLCGSLLLACANAQADCDYDDFPRMDGMLVSSLGGNVQWNHSPMAGRSFRVPATVEQVKTFYTGKWQEVDFTEFNGWEQILHINKHCMMMLQVRAQNDRFSYGRMLLTTFVLAIVASLLAGLLPAWRACLVSPAMQLKTQ